jgi:hypothetical protein
MQPIQGHPSRHPKKDNKENDKADGWNVYE